MACEAEIRRASIVGPEGAGLSCEQYQKKGLEREDSGEDRRDWETEEGWKGRTSDELWHHRSFPQTGCIPDSIIQNLISWSRGNCQELIVSLFCGSFSLDL